MKIYVGVTDSEWYEYINNKNLREVNFWRPGGQVFKALERNDFFLTRLSFGETKSDLKYLKEMIYGCNNLYDENSTDSKPLKRLYNKAKKEMEIEENEGKR